MDKTSDSKYQYLAAFCVNIIAISYGAVCGWPSATFLELQADTSPLETGPLSNEAAGWVASILCLGGVIGTVFFAWLSDRIGRKRCLLWITLPSLLGWVIIPYARNPLHLCVARVLGGFAGGGVFAVIPIYIIELAEASVRGILGIFLLLACNFGVLLAFSLGCYFDYVTVAWIMSTLSVLFVICFVFMPETPQYLAQHNKLEHAEKSLRYYRNIRSVTSKELSEDLQMELLKLCSAEKTDDTKEGADSAVTWADFAEPKARKAFWIGLGLYTTNQACGCFALLNFTGVIFQQAGSNLSPTIAAIFVGAIQLAGTYVSTLLVERAGRKVLLLISAFGVGLTQSSMGTYSYLSILGYEASAFSWVPVAGFSLMMFLAAWGLLTLPFVVTSEILPVKIRSKGIMILMTFLWMLSGVMIKLIPVLTESLGMHGTFFLFAILSFASGVFIAIFVPETKGKTLEDILANL